MLTQLASTVLYAILAASVLFQIVTAARFAARAAWKPNARRQQARPAVVAPRVRVSRIRRRDYRLALRAARASVSPKA